jgi:hypothetical protein
MTTLRRIDISGIRGFPNKWGSISIGERGLIIYGDNGTGKSSVVDALEYVLTRDTTIFPESRQNVSWDTAATHVRCDSYDAAVSLSHLGAEYLLGINESFDNIPSAIQGIVQAAQSSRFIFRRHMLVDFIIKQPNKRYTALESFLNLDQFTEIEARLKEFAEQAKTDKTAIQSSGIGHNVALHRALRLEQQIPIDEKTVLTGLNSLLDVAGIPSCQDIGAASEALKLSKGKLDSGLSSKRLGSISALKANLEKIPSTEAVSPIAKIFVEAASSYAEARKEATEEALSEWLVDGVRFVESRTDETCPLCEQPIEKEKLLERLTARIESNRKVIDATRLYAQRRGQFFAVAEPAELVLAQVNQDWEPVVGQNAPKELEKYYKSISSSIEISRRMPLDFDALERVLNDVCIDKQISGYISTVDALFGIEGGEQRQKLTAAVDATTAVVNDYPKIENLRRQFQDKERQYNEAISLCTHAAEVRKCIVQGIFDKIAKQANYFYSILHPEEAIGYSQLAVKKSADKSVNLTAVFDSRTEHPLVHYSESHLDTLGLCYFLAVRKYESQREPSFRLLVLDDVVTSVDSKHRLRIANLLKSEFSDHQIIITTHDKFFYGYLQRALGNANFKYVVINGWDLELGPRLGDPHCDLERIRKPERDTISQEELSGACGRLIESLLKNVAAGIQCSIRYQLDKEPTIADLWGPVQKKLKGQSEFNQLYSTLLQDFDSSKWIRNKCSAHDDEAPACVTNSEAASFAILLESLYDALYCKTCGHCIKTKQNGKDWECRCGLLNYKARPY